MPGNSVNFGASVYDRPECNNLWIPVWNAYVQHFHLDAWGVVLP